MQKIMYICSLEFISRVTVDLEMGYLSEGATRPIPWEDAEKMMAACEDDPQLHCFLSLGFYTAMRYFELADVRFIDVVDKTHYTFIGKGNKERRVKLHPKLVESIKVWHGEFSKNLFYDPEMRLIHNKKDKYGRYAPISLYASYTMLKRAVKKSGVYVYKPTCHFLRKTFATAIYEKLGSTEKAVVTVAGLLGHANYGTTMHYLGLEEKIFDELYDIL